MSYYKGGELLIDVDKRLEKIFKRSLNKYELNIHQLEDHIISDARPSKIFDLDYNIDIMNSINPSMAKLLKDRQQSILNQQQGSQPDKEFDNVRKLKQFDETSEVKYFYLEVFPQYK